MACKKEKAAVVIEGATGSHLMPDTPLPPAPTMIDSDDDMRDRQGVTQDSEIERAKRQRTNDEQKVVTATPPREVSPIQEPPSAVHAQPVSLEQIYQAILDNTATVQSLGTRLTHCESHQRGMSERLTRLEQRPTMNKEDITCIVKEQLQSLPASSMAPPPVPAGKGSSRARSQGPPSRKSSAPASRAPSTIGEDETENARMSTAVLGGLPRDSRRKVLLELAGKFLTHVASEHAPVDIYTPGLRASVVLLRFATPEEMWSFIKTAKAKPFALQDGTAWISPSRTRDERIRNRIMWNMRTALLER
eukprot:6236646-Amphidinium_carterae.1